MSTSAERKQEIDRRYRAAREAGLTDEEILTLARVTMRAVLERTYHFSPAEARRIAFARWLKVHGRIDG